MSTSEHQLSNKNDDPDVIMDCDLSLKQLQIVLAALESYSEIGIYNSNAELLANKEELGLLIMKFSIVEDYIDSKLAAEERAEQQKRIEFFPDEEDASMLWGEYCG